MKVANKKSHLILLAGDIIGFTASLWLTLLLRDLETPSNEWFFLHLRPFSLLFVAWILVFFIAGLYEKYTVMLKSKLSILVFNAQLVNVILAALFFFTIPYFAITPKTVLGIYLVISSIIITLWRMYLFPLIDTGKQQRALLIDGGCELKDLYEEINNNSRYNIQFVRVIDVDNADGSTLSERIYNELKSDDITAIVVNTNHKKLVGVFPHLYKPIFSDIQFIKSEGIYEDIFERVPLSSIEYSDFIYHIPFTTKNTYNFLKRLLDITLVSVLGIISLIVYPFVILSIKLEDRGKIFISQRRIGERNTIVILYKFRTMQFNEHGKWLGETENKITKVGKFLRKSRIDELPQLFNVLRGDISLIGPRPDVEGLDERSRKEIPHYNLRYSVKPGLSGWAQLKQEYEKGHYSPQSIEETRRRLEYDLYYIKNRSFILDLMIALRTLKVIVSKLGS